MRRSSRQGDSQPTAHALLHALQLELRRRTALTAVERVRAMPEMRLIVRVVIATVNQRPGGEHEQRSGEVAVFFDDSAAPARARGCSRCAAAVGCTR